MSYRIRLESASGVLTAKQAPHRPGTAPALGLRAGCVVELIVSETVIAKESYKGGSHVVIGGSRGPARKHRRRRHAAGTHGGPGHARNTPRVHALVAAAFANLGAPDAVGPGSKFQVQPTPYLGNCDPTRASTAHPGGMQVSLADGSVRTLAPSMSGTTWWAAVTPADGEVLGSDW